MKPQFLVCLFLAFALSYANASECGSTRNVHIKSFEQGVYVSVETSSHTRAQYEFLKYSHRLNHLGVALQLGPLIAQVEKPCNGSSKRTIFSRLLPSMYNSNPPMPYSKLLKLDYQLGKSGKFYSKTVLAFSAWFLAGELRRFAEYLKCTQKSFMDNWFYLAYNTAMPFGYADIRFQQGSPYLRKKKRCPPNDSNIKKLCNGKSGFSCPNMTFEETNGVSVRNISMYIVTGKPTPGKNCSFDHARFTQYMGNHHYFMGNNTKSKKMQRTIPVMTKAIRITSHPDPCKKEYQMQFYVNTAHLDNNNLPCPIQAGVMLQKVENMQIYVKTLNGNPDTDMSQVNDLFTKELDRKNMTYVTGSHYIAQYRGHGPMFGRTMEIWVEKTVPNYVTICEGGPVVTTTHAQETTTPEVPSGTTLGQIIVSYY